MNYLLIGKPNVGKSSIFNILTSSNINIVHNEGGTTRDWHEELINGTSSYIYDTPGVIINDNRYFNLVDSSINKFFKGNNAFLYVIDFQEGYNEIDKFSINYLRKFNKDIILIVNKFDNINKNHNVDFLKYGISKMVYISCAHNYGIDELKSLLKLNHNNTKNTFDYSIAIFGKPNVGKSTLLNTFLGYERALTSSKANTTSDFVIDFLKYKKKIIKIIDTAGIGKKSNIKNKSINYFAIKKSLSNMHNIDISLIIIDSFEGIDRQDKRIIKLVANKSKYLVLIYNKFDLIDEKQEYKNNVIQRVSKSLSEIKNIKIFFISAYQIKSVYKTLDYIHNLFLNDRLNLSTSKINQWLKKVVNEYSHPLIENKSVNFKYALQVNTNPLTIKIFCNYSKKIKAHYKKYLINNFNLYFNIINKKSNIIFTSAKNPYV